MQERRKNSVLAGLGVYGLLLSFTLGIVLKGEISPKTWIGGYWIIQLFVSVNAVAKSFMSETEGQKNYLYQLARPQTLVLAKMVYNAGLMLLLAWFTLITYSLFLPHPFVSLGWFWLISGLGGIGLGIGMTLISALVSAAGNNAVLMAILSIPVMLPQVLMLIGLSKALFLDTLFQTGGLLMFGFFFGIQLLSVLLTLLLFPFLWSD